MSMPGGSEWLLIIIALLLLFGARKVPELMRGLGKGVREFKDAKKGMEQEIDSGINNKKPAPGK